MERLLLVTGGRGFLDQRLVGQVLDGELRRVGPDRLWLLQGGAGGADRLAREWASRRAVPCLTMHAHWDRAGLRAGPERNQWMVDLANRLIGEWPQAEPTMQVLAIAFPGGKGTADMVRRCRDNDIEVVEIAPLAGEGGGR